MATRTGRTLQRQLHSLFNLGAIRELTDGQLLERFATDSGEAAELAFAALIERHGAMVLCVCLAQLRNTHDAHDAFQATFLVLIRRARSLWIHDSLGPWLHQVAFRTACCARSAIARRRRLDQVAAERDRNERHPTSNGSTSSTRKSAAFRSVTASRSSSSILEGHSCEEVARRMGRPVGTIKKSLIAGPDRLRDRMIRLERRPRPAWQRSCRQLVTLGCKAPRSPMHWGFSRIN